MRTLCLVLAAILCAAAAEFHTPAGTRPAKRTEEGLGTILPGGRLLNPYGAQYITGPGPFGLAVSPSGDRAVTADGGLDRFSLSFLEMAVGQWSVRRLPIPPDAAGKSEEAWKSTFMGLAFGDEETLYASEGESGQVRVLDPATGKTRHILKLDQGSFANSYSGDLALDRERGILYVVDQANFRIAIFDTAKRALIASVPTGRLPFATALSPDARRLYVTNIGMFAYKIPRGADVKRARETGLEFPAFGFPSKEAFDGAMRKNASGEPVAVPGLGDPNVPESNSLCVIDVADPAHPSLMKFIRTGLPFGAKPGVSGLGGSSPAGVLAEGNRVYVTNSVNDTISIIDADGLTGLGEIPLRIPGLENLRGILPIGMAYWHNRLLVAEAGINAVAVIYPETRDVEAHIPAGWFPTRVQVFGDTIYVANAKGHGIGPNATLEAPLPHSFQMERRKGSISRYQMPRPERYAELTRTVITNNGFEPAEALPAIPSQIRHVVIIVKENRTFAEVFGDVAGAPKLARYGRAITPNHHALADRFAISDNFYADSEVSVDGHHWLVGSYPNAWTESTMMAAYGGAKGFRLTPESPGRLQFPESNSSLHPEDTLEAGALWHHLDRHRISFRNFGEGFELAGVDEGKGLKPTGARFLTNVPMPEPLYLNTARDYPNFNMNIPDQFRATNFIHDIEVRYRKPGKLLPRLLFIHLPNDHTAEPRPEDGYPNHASFVADNDLALGRMVEYLSHSPWWKQMAIFVTEDDAGGGVDPIDAHRTVVLAISPYAKRNYVAHINTSFVSILRAAYSILGLPPLNLYDATAGGLNDCFTSAPDFRAFAALPEDPSIFDPAKAREPMGPKPSVRMDDPAFLRKQHNEPKPK